MDAHEYAREHCPLFPEVLLVTNDSHRMFTTFVRIKRLGVWYTVQVSSGVMITQEANLEDNLISNFENFLQIVHETSLYYVIEEKDVPAADQSDEDDRYAAVLFAKGRIPTATSSQLRQETDLQHYEKMIGRAGVIMERIEDNNEISFWLEISEGTYYTNFHLDGRFKSHEYSSSHYSE